MLLACLMLTAWAPAEELTDEQVIELLETEQPRDKAIARALAWIRTQQREDGSLAEGQNCTAMTAFGLMAHLAAGIVYDDEEHGAWMRKSLDFVLRQQSPDGYFGEKDGSRMYGHGVATLLLAESVGMTADAAQDERVRELLEKAVARTVGAATQVKKRPGCEGGWRYHPSAEDADLSLSGWQLMGLHACQQIGITVPEQVVQRAAEYGKRLTGEDGQVGYTRKGEDHPALRGLGMLCFSIAGNGDDPLVDAISRRIQQYPIEWKGSWFFYRAYYDAVGMSRARPDDWDAYKGILEGVLLEHQHEEGWWQTPPNDNEGRFGRVYITAMAVLALAVEHHALPVYQR